MSAKSPHSNLDFNLSSKNGISLGGLSLDKIICFLSSYKVLKVWKNSSWILSLPAINWTSSTNKTSTFLYLFLNISFLLSFIALISWLVNFSEVTYKTLVLMLSSNILLPIACIKWVFPRPTPPYKNNGL